MTLPQRLLVDLIAAIAAQPAPRKPGIHAYVPAILALGLVLGLPLFLALVAVLRLLSWAHPVVKLPYLDFGLMAACGGMIVMDELVRRWRAPIEARLAVYDALEPRARSALRVRTLAAGLAAAAALLALCVAVLAR
jgi:hypothetical protein